MSEPTPALLPAINQRIRESERILQWVQSKLNGMKIPQLPDDKRSQLASACWHVAIDHSMAIVVLVRETLHGSALALIRPLFEAYIRRMWLMYAATDDIDRAGRAACEEQADHQLQGRPLGVIPFAGAVQSCVIAANALAKRAGVTTGMASADARRRCPGTALVAQ